MAFCGHIFLRLHCTCSSLFLCLLWLQQFVKISRLIHFSLALVVDCSTCWGSEFGSRLPCRLLMFIGRQGCPIRSLCWGGCFPHFFTVKISFEMTKNHARQNCARVFFLLELCPLNLVSLARSRCCICLMMMFCVLLVFYCKEELSIFYHLFIQ